MWVGDIYQRYNVCITLVVATDFFSMSDICSRTLHICIRARVSRYTSFIGKATVWSTIGGIPLLCGSLCSSEITIVVVIINMRYADDAFDFPWFPPLYTISMRNRRDLTDTSFRELSIPKDIFHILHCEITYFVILQNYWNA